nr:MAG TPA: hypothetical protein [Caudoviricetes sp.]
MAFLPVVSGVTRCSVGGHRGSVFCVGYFTFDSKFSVIDPKMTLK